jgi:hypothetical protein
VGKSNELTEQQVKGLQSKDSEKPEKWMLHRLRPTWLA